MSLTLHAHTLHTDERAFTYAPHSHKHLSLDTHLWRGILPGGDPGEHVPQTQRSLQTCTQQSTRTTLTQPAYSDTAQTPSSKAVAEEQGAVPSITW